MNTNETTKSIPFRKFLEKSVHLISVLGVFNAIAVFAGTIKDQNQEILTTIAFISMLISLLVINELLTFASNSDDKSYKYTVFKIGMILMEVFLAYYIFNTYRLQVLLSIYGVLAFLFYYGFNWGINKIHNKKIIECYEKHKSLILSVVIGFSLFLSYKISIILMPLLVP
jgi:hypothetical protein